MSQAEFCIFNGEVAEHENETLPLFHNRRNIPVSAITNVGDKKISNSKLFVTLFGRNSAGDSVAIILNDWAFWFYVALEDHHRDPEKVIADLRSGLPKGTTVSCERRFQAVGYRCDANGKRLARSFLKLCFTSINKAYWAKTFLLRKGFRVCEADTFTSCHNRVFIIAQLLEFLSSSDNPCSWFSWLGVRNLTFAQPSMRYTHCKYEAIVSFRSLFLLPPRVFIPRLNIVSVDIECFSPDDKVFPVATSCPVIAIGLSVYSYNPCGDSSIVRRLCFSYCKGQSEARSAVPIPESEHNFELRLFPSEIEMLEAWRDCVVFELDVDVLVGYNIWKFDVPYLIDRVHTLNPKSRFFLLGRLLQSSSYYPEVLDSNGVKAGSFSSTAMGDNDQTLFRAPGLGEIDVYMQAKKRKGFSSYKLGAIARSEIAMDKIELPHTEINRCFRENDYITIAAYCVRDTELPVLIMEKWGGFDEFLALSKTTFTPISTLASAGQTVKVRNMLFHTGHSLGFVYNAVEFSSGKCQGATVIDPVPGYYLEHVATLDFNSLYPKCIIMGNLCLSTYVLPDADELPLRVETRQILNHRFVQSVVGIVPTMLTNLLSARTLTKKRLADAKSAGRVDEIKQLDSLQLAYKLCANGTYGYFNSPGMYKCTALAESTTALGRGAIDTAREIAEGAPYLCSVIYGDTDSIMIRMPGGNGLADDWRLATTIAEAITTHFDRKLVIELEKIYFPYLIAKKKRYCGLLYTSPAARPVVPDCKGFEIVRKDTFDYCHALQEKLFGTLVAPFSHSLGISIEAERLTRWNSAVEIIAHFVGRMRDKAVPFSDLVVSKSLRRKYKNEGSVVQAVVNQQIMKLTPGLEFPPGDRVPYLIVNGSVHIQADKIPALREKTTAMSECAVFSDFFSRYDIFNQNLDWKYYVERVRPTVIQVMSLVFPARIKEVERIFRDAYDILHRTMRTFSGVAHRDIASFFPSGALVMADESPPPPILFPAPSTLSVFDESTAPQSKSSVKLVNPNKRKLSTGAKIPPAKVCAVAVASPPVAKKLPAPHAAKKYRAVNSISSFFKAAAS